MVRHRLRGLGRRILHVNTETIRHFQNDSHNLSLTYLITVKPRYMVTKSPHTVDDVCFVFVDKCPNLATTDRGASPSYNHTRPCTSIVLSAIGGSYQWHARDRRKSRGG